MGWGGGTEEASFKQSEATVKVLADIFYYGIKRREGGIGDNSLKESEATVDLNADILTNKWQFIGAHVI